MKQLYKLINTDVRRRCWEAIKAAPEGHVVTIAEPTRSLDQNAAQWPILQAFAEQIQWPVNGVMSRLSDEEWKDVLTAAFKQELVRVVPGLSGGMVLLGQRTSKFNKAEFSEWLEFLHSVAAERGVIVEYLA